MDDNEYWANMWNFIFRTVQVIIVCATAYGIAELVIK